jgi:hypothetical protein
MEEGEAWFLPERAEQLALLYFVRRHDLHIVEPDADYGLDLLIALDQEEEHSEHVFGVEIKAYRSRKSFQAALSRKDGILGAGRLPSYQDLPFPVFLFVFLMDSDEGYHHWINGPTDDQAGKVRISFDRFRKLETNEIDNIVRIVHQWYEENQKTYRILIDGSWTVNDFSNLFAPYSQMYAFLDLLRRPPTGPAEQKKLKKAYQSHPWQGGYSRVNFFSDLKSLAPALGVTSLQYASPGWMEFDMSVPTARHIRLYVRNYIQSEHEVQTWIKRTSKMLQSRGLTRHNVRSRDFSLSMEDTQVLESAVRELSGLLAFEHLDQVAALARNPLVTLKVLMAFCVRIQKLAKYQRREMVVY